MTRQMRPCPLLAPIDLPAHQRDRLLVDLRRVPGFDGGEIGLAGLVAGAGALSSTANFLKAHGWRAGAGYQPGEPNFAAIEAWNAAQVYQKAIALMGRQIDGGE